MLLNRYYLYYYTKDVNFNKSFSSENIYIQHIKVYNNLTESFFTIV